MRPPADPASAEPSGRELNLAALHEAIAARVPDRDCIVWRDRRHDWARTTDRTRRLAAVLRTAGPGLRRPLAECEGWESPHDHVALYLHNGNEYLEGMLGAYKARWAPVNVNYRYVADELAYVLADSGARAIVYAGTFAPLLAEVRPRLPELELLIQVDDGSGADLLPGALDYEAALAAADPAPPTALSPDDLYIVYTGGTTGAPKGVLWRQTDFLAACLGVRGPQAALVERAVGRSGLRVLPAPPLMHGAAHWNAISAWTNGGTIVMQHDTTRLRADDVWDTVARHRVTSLLIVGDAFARPLVDELAARPRDVSSLRFLLTGGAVLSAALRAELGALLPDVTVVDVLGSSETGRQAVARSRTGERGTGFAPEATAVVLSEDRSRRLGRDERELGWLAQTGAVPRGYLGDEPKSQATFPVLEGVRHAVAGDRARWAPDGTVELHGRDAATINTGGEKVFAEEVEQALRTHPAVYDVLVVGRPDPRWGSEVVAVVALRPEARTPAGGDGPAPGTPAADTLAAEIVAAAAGQLARYKLPRAMAFVAGVERSPSGKPDYAWARAQAATATPVRTR